MDAKTISTQYQEGRNELTSKKQRWVSQLVLLNNLRRGDENIASTMLYTLFNRVLSNLYDDKMMIKFVPAEDGDDKKTELLNKLAINDYREMQKDKLDYLWLWDTLFFGRGYIETLKWDSERKIMKPEVINPLYFIYDPFFSEPQEWRYYGKWILRSKFQIQKLIDNGIITGITRAEELPSGIEEELWSYKTKVENARDGNSATSNSIAAGDTAGTAIYQIYEHYAYNEKGEKSVYWTDKNFAKVLMEKKLDLKDGEDGESKWPIVVKEAFKEAHSDLSLSLIDVIEDKHRALNVLYNLAYFGAKDEANPIYKYNPELVTDVSQLFQRQILQHIPVSDMAGSIEPLNKAPTLSQPLLMFIALLKGEMSEPLGSGTSAIPGKKGKISATETAMQQQLNDLATSLQSKIIGIAEKEFWGHWYQRIKRYTKDSDKKILALTSVKGVSVSTLFFKDIKTNYPPGVMVFSSKEAEFKELVLRRDLMQLYPAMQKSLDPAGFRNWNKHIFMPKFIEDSSTIDLVFPDSLNEIRATQENEMLNENRMVDVQTSDDDRDHLYVHNEGKNTPAMWAHRFWHEEQMAQKEEQRKQMEAQGGKPDATATAGAGNPQQYPTPGQKTTTNKEAAVPLQPALASSMGRVQKN